MKRWISVGLLLVFGALLASCGGAAGGTGAQGGAGVQVGAKSAPPGRSTAYDIVSKERVDGDGRQRVQAKIVIEGDLDEDGAIEAIRGAIQELLPADGEVEVVEVLVYRDRAETSGDWTVGHGFASKDGKGWKGDGRFEGGFSDRSNIELTLKLPSGEDHFSLAR